MVNIQTTGAFAAEAAFEGAYDKRVAKRENESAAKAYRQTEKTSVQEHLGDGVNITISQESQEFMAGVDDRKAAQRAEKEALREQYSANPFAYSGNAISLTNLETGERVAQEPSQWRVFSENLYKNGFYDNMSDEEVQKMEGMLKSITYGVDSISGLTDAERSYSAFSHEGAKLEFISSINALNYYADNYVPDEMRESFKNLIKAYEDYNSESVAKHKNSDDLYSEAMSKISAPNAVNVKEAVKKTQEQTVASQAIGKVTHTDEEEAKQKQDYQALFDKLINDKESVGSIFDEMKNALVNYASGGSKNSTVLDLLNSRNANSFSNMFNYWSKLLSE